MLNQQGGLFNTQQTDLNFKIIKMQGKGQTKKMPKVVSKLSTISITLQFQGLKGLSLHIALMIVHRWIR